MHAWLKFEGYSSRNEAATPLRSSKLKWAWRAQFLSHNLQILWKFIFFESLQMIVKPSLAISNSIEFGKKWSSPPSMCKGVLGFAIGFWSEIGDDKIWGLMTLDIERPDLYGGPCRSAAKLALAVVNSRHFFMNSMKIGYHLWVNNCV